MRAPFRSGAAGGLSLQRLFVLPACLSSAGCETLMVEGPLSTERFVVGAAGCGTPLLLEALLCLEVAAAAAAPANLFVMHVRVCLKMLAVDLSFSIAFDCTSRLTRSGTPHRLPFLHRP